MSLDTSNMPDQAMNIQNDNAIYVGLSNGQFDCSNFPEQNLQLNLAVTLEVN